MAESQTKESQEEFDAQREQDRNAQGLTSEKAVPEQRPQASQQLDPSTESRIYREELENGERDPMPKSAFDKAASKSQLSKAEKTEKKTGPETLRDGQPVNIVKGKYRGAAGVIIEVEFASHTERQKYNSGNPAVARFAKASSYIVRTRGQGQFVEVKPTEIEIRTQPLGVNASEL